ncbi:unnamed protein product [Onchocerca flexuosa]|uniref:Transthyretin-like family protein n=1 Tax=Onchocerca flexuosa TaxID=387005 RepID=A0A183I672_9BILA|nr:unnamed protein product [Onchocerca flexuosa]
MLPYQLLLLLIISSVAYGLFGSKKNITVVGKFNCGENHYPDVKIELWDARALGLWDALFWRGNKLETTYTDESGRFRLFVQRKQIRNMKPYLEVYHSCNDGKHDEIHHKSRKISLYPLKDIS